MTLKSIPWPVWLIAGLLILGGLVGGDAAKDWYARKKALEARRAADQQVIDGLTRQNHQLQATVDAFGQQVIKRDTVIRILRQKAESIPVPDTCKTVVAAWKVVVDSQDVQIKDLKTIVSADSTIIANNTVTDSIKQASIDSLVDLTNDAPVKTPFWKHLLPELRVTVGPAYTPTEKTPFHPLAISVGASWKIPVKLF